MKLILLRHAAAEPRDQVRFPDDDLRPLTPEGIRIQKKVTKALGRMRLRPDRIVTSPRVRARETAAITAEGLGLADRLTLSEVLGADYSVTAVLALLRGFGPDETVLCVGHEPDFSELAGTLLGPAEGPAIAFKKSGVLGISFDDAPVPGAGMLLFFYRPKDLAALV